MFDIIIKNGRIISGCGNPWYRADIGIVNDLITFIGDLSNEFAKRVIDADSYIISPGFIDSHSHGDLRILGNPCAEEKLLQGVTTEINGQCSIGLAPIKDEDKDMWRKYTFGVFGDYPEVDFNWNTFEEYLERVSKVRPSINTGYMIPYGSVRLMVMGIDNKSPSDVELNSIKRIIEIGMKEGALGLSFGMIYVPTVFASERELVEVCKVVGQYKGLVTIHIKNEGYLVENSLEEAIELARKSGASFHITHLKAAGKKNYRKTVYNLLSVLEKAREESLDITFDQYPYDAASTMLKQLMPPWILEGGNESMKMRIERKDIREKVNMQINGTLPLEDKYLRLGWDNHVSLAGWDGIFITSVHSSKNQCLIGKSIRQIAVEMGKQSIDVVCDILIEEDGAAGMAAFMMDEEDVKVFMKHNLQMVGTDGLFGGKPHPRLYGTFPRILGKYVRDEKVLSLPEAIRKMTSYPAQRYNIQDRGVIAEGMKADITIFDPDRVIDKATFDNPYQHPEGIEYVIINGRIAVDDGKLADIGYGQVLRRKQF